MAVLSVLAALVTLVAGAEHDPAWEAYKTKFSKHYSSPEEEAERYGIFKQSLLRIEELNARNVKGGGGEVFGLNPTSDRKQVEKWARGAKKPHGRVRDEKVMEVESPKNPPSIDWRLTPVVTPVKNQGQCGSCWAFSVAETVESSYVLKTGIAYGVTLSPQQIASCATACDGCGGGWTQDGYDYLQTVPGLASDWFWPYAQGLTPSGSCTDASCTQSCSAHNISKLTPDEFYIGHYAAISGFQYATPECNDECENQDLTKLAQSLEKGPVSICVNAGAWDDYVSGVMTASGCGGGAAYLIDHCVQLVGFNNTAENPYWIVRNSWDTTWGMDGYIHLQFDANTCGLADEATVPTISNGKTASEEWKEDMFTKATAGFTKKVDMVV
jgi:hypothetical protein